MITLREKRTVFLDASRPILVLIYSTGFSVEGRQSQRSNRNFWTRQGILSLMLLLLVHGGRHYRRMIFLDASRPILALIYCTDFSVGSCQSKG